MKLLRLKLGIGFRSLAEGFEIDFLREWDHDRCFMFNPYCLAGRNGSGKSNVLEALAAIFYHIECIYLENEPDNFRYDEERNPNGFRSEVCTPDAFVLEYFMPLTIGNLDVPIEQIDVSLGDLDHVHIVISKTAKEAPKILCKNLRFFNEKDGTLSRDRIRRFLPKYIIGYSSGHNEILSLPFFKMRFIQFDEYRENLAREDRSKKLEGRMIYVDDQFSQAILICHFLFPSEAVTKVFADKDKAGLKGIRRFRIIIRRHHRIPISEERLGGLSAEDRKVRAKATDELTSLLNGFEDRQGLKEDEIGKYRLGLIDKLIKCSSAYYEDSYVTKEGDEASDLYLDYWVNDATKRAFQVLFGETSGKSKELDKAMSALNLFQSFQTLLTLNHYQVDDVTKAELYHSGSLYVNETIPTPASHDRITRFKEGELIKDGVNDEIYVKSLSDGEQQFLHTIGLCLLYRHENALFLLDEPETHLNPDWRASYISTLRVALEADEATKNVMREVILTSHSPFIISDCHPENVLVFEKDKDGKATHERPGFNTFGASASLITMEIFKRDETIGDHSNKKLSEMVDKINEPEVDARSLVREINREFGESVERTMALGRVLQASEPTKE